MKYFHHQGHLYRILREIRHHNFPDKRGNMQAIQTGYTPEQAERFRRR